MLRVRVRVRDSTLGAKKRCLFKSVAFRFGFRVRVRDSRDSTLGAKKRCLFKSVAFRFGFRVRVRDSTLGAKKRGNFRSEEIF